MYTPDPRRKAPFPLPARRTAGLRHGLLRWYRRRGRDLPWRRTSDPYRILVSEVLLQQTPVARVIPAYRRFLARFPSLRALARASLGEVLVQWGTLGYPRRARDLHRLARLTRGRLIADVDALDALPGIGRYTAGAVVCFSGGAPVAFADTNIRRVLGRVLLGRTASEHEALALDAAVMPRRAAARWHHALMDLGATVCLARSPRCRECPVLDLCVAKGHDAAPARRQQRPFATSDRRVRGAILRELRSARTTTVSGLRRAVADARVPRLVAALAAEGLVERHGARVSLPR